MEILGLLVVLVAAYWAKNNLLKPDTSKAIDDSCRRAVDSVKKTFSNKIENVAEVPERQDVVAPVVEKQAAVVDEHLSQSNKVTQNIAAPAETVSQTVVAKKIT
jgi:predicted RND superfamily exporter protein